jgi:XTP/dITP diphosphohydrolase
MNAETTIVLATRNQGKIRELAEMFKGFDVRVLGLSDYPAIGEIPETGDTFEENSLIKAKAVAEATGHIAVADDSGLEVDALDGAPGVFSARYAGEDADDAANNAKLLREMVNVSDDKRSARFRCVMTAYAPGGKSILAEGAWEGSITRAPEGENGFGYDPLFFDPEEGCTSASLDKEQKNAKSHRGKALRKLMEQWPEFLEG